MITSPSSSTPTIKSPSRQNLKSNIGIASPKKYRLLWPAVCAFTILHVKNRPCFYSLKRHRLERSQKHSFPPQHEVTKMVGSSLNKYMFDICMSKNPRFRTGPVIGGLSVRFNTPTIEPVVGSHNFISTSKEVFPFSTRFSQDEVMTTSSFFAHRQLLSFTLLRLFGKSILHPLPKSALISQCSTIGVHTAKFAEQLHTHALPSASDAVIS